MTNADDPNESVSLWDLAPEGGRAPWQFQSTRGLALQLIEAAPKRYRLAQPGDVAPTTRSDHKPIIVRNPNQ